MHESEKWKWSCLVVSDSSWPHGLQPTRLLHPWDFPGKSTRVGCHCLLHESWLHARNCMFWFISHQNKREENGLTVKLLNFVFKYNVKNKDPPYLSLWLLSKRLKVDHSPVFQGRLGGCWSPAVNSRHPEGCIEQCGYIIEKLRIIKCFMIIKILATFNECLPCANYYKNSTHTVYACVCLHACLCIWLHILIDSHNSLFR